jgi:hypothetical protein
MRLEITQQPGQRAWAEEDVRVHAQDELRIGLAKDRVPDGGALSSPVRKVAVPCDLLLEVLQRLGARAAGVIVQDKDLGAVGHLRMVEAYGLHGEVHAVVVVVRRHADREEAARSAGRWSERGGPVPDQALVQNGGGMLIERRSRIDLPEDPEQGILGQLTTSGGIARSQPNHACFS